MSRLFLLPRKPPLSGYLSGSFSCHISGMHSSFNSLVPLSHKFICTCQIMCPEFWLGQDENFSPQWSVTHTLCHWPACIACVSHKYINNPWLGHWTSTYPIRGPSFYQSVYLTTFFFLIQRLLGKKQKNWLKEWKKGRGDEDNKISLREMSLLSPSLRPTLQPHGLRHARLPPLSHRVCSNSCPSRWWCHPTISSSVVPFSSCLQSFPAPGSFPIHWLFASGGHSIGASASASARSQVKLPSEVGLPQSIFCHKSIR